METNAALLAATKISQDMTPEGHVMPGLVCHGQQRLALKTCNLLDLPSLVEQSVSLAWCNATACFGSFIVGGGGIRTRG
jgi:hypothetical protein